MAFSFERNTPHIEGNWPSHIYIPVNSTPALNKIFEVCLQHYSEVSPLLIIREKSFHISLSKPFYLRHHHIESFVEKLKLGLTFSSSCLLEIHPEYQILTNETKTRSFLTVPVEDCNGCLKQLISCADTALTSFKQERYYTDPLFHISIASMALSETQEKAINNQRDSHEPVVHVYMSSCVEERESEEEEREEGRCRVQDEMGEEREKRERERESYRERDREKESNGEREKIFEMKTELVREREKKKVKEKKRVLKDDDICAEIVRKREEDSLMGHNTSKIHVSILEGKRALQQTVPLWAQQDEEDSEDQENDEVHVACLSVHSVRCRIGDKEFDFPLRSPGEPTGKAGTGALGAKRVRVESYR
mmetsp:Transcript_29124/g.29479  ORF Transcript_29124/g.29479 Transcript_29124/m.29479 type:complete len:364 (+) Transcript_29124:139-1230(+)